MKIGIITFHSALNYGAFLQALALQEYLRDLGTNVQIIDYHLYEDFIGLKWKRIPVVGVALNWYRKNKDNKKRLHFYGDRPIGSYLELTKK